MAGDPHPRGGMTGALADSVVVELRALADDEDEAVVWPAVQAAAKTAPNAHSHRRPTGSEDTTEDRPSWRYFERVAERVVDVASVVELQAGTGSMIGRLPELPALAVATEGWAPSAS